MLILFFSHFNISIYGNLGCHIIEEGKNETKNNKV
jgi:hypothetical protein